MAFLVWDSPEGRHVRELDRAVLILGRDPVADLRIDDPTVSRRHALVQVEGDLVTVTDLDSTAGTRINGARLSPQMPSTLQPGDFVQVGKATLTFHHVAPPAPVGAAPPPPAPPSPPAAPAAPRRPAAQGPVSRRPVAPARGAFPWKWVALGLAVVLVGGAGVLLGTQLGEGDERPPPALAEAGSTPPPEESKPPQPAPPQPEAPSPEPPAAPSEEQPAGPERAPAGELPPRRAVPADEFPDLLQVDHESHLPGKVVALGAATVEALGADGRLYVLPRGKVTKIEDRADLARRATLRRMALDREDADGRMELARWCRHRLLIAEARTLVEEVLALRPTDEEAISLRHILMREE